MILTFLGSLVFVGLGLWLLTNPPVINLWLFGDPRVIFMAGLASVIFFGLISVTVFRKISDKKPGLIINRQGITDNSSGVSAGQILWTDIKEIIILEEVNQKILVIIVKNPDDYLKKVSNPLKWILMKMTHGSYGSPISISSNALQTNLDDLYKLLMKKMNQYKS